jgi:hypothetical protein
MASFEDRRDQWPEDLKVVKDLGRKYRGKGTWPLFRDHTPGLMPWFLSGAQARFLAGALLVALEVGKRCEGDDTLFHGPPGTVPGFLPGPSRTPVKWNPVRIHAPRVQRDETLPALPADEVRLKKFLKSAARGDMVLEVDVAHAPMAIQDDGRPYFPLILLGVEPRNDFVFSVALASPMEPRMYLLDRFLDGLETQKVLPKEILFKRGEIAALLGASLDLLGVPMRQVKSLPAHDRARRAMETMVCRGK